ncbi:MULTISPECIES: hypothetical protein [unclassified Kaistella]|uniref:hypothetical protein n=1 Tax=unclassified Kaistella TaxID=2762626 RepID=UPI002733B9DA|nr:MULTISPECIES: hypothetical protein [unclassified Kaistella]MDP2453101.1 hypothetical protein [Kaistella sp. SH11-4b]MDP2456158.1 hypothetical protein [Kaistella sp. SH40-3]MDP2458914.1 hypothetical protein [Kaistella sp. SH19-2b]
MKKLILSCFLAGSVLANAQIFDLLKNTVKDKATNIVGDKVIGAITTETITTNFKDCNKIDVKNADFGKNEKYTNLCNIPFSPSEGYLLKPGFYTIELKSFCLHAGTYAPSKGDGYLYGPLKGQKKDLVNSLIKNWYNNQDIPQQKVQSLVWGVIAKSSFKNMSPDLQLVATRLLSKNELLSLSKMGLDFVPASVMSKAKGNLPKSVQMVLEAENQIRSFFSSSSSNYSELEKLALLTGVNPVTSEISYGTWGLHPNGYWTSYQPHGYRQMTVRIFVPNTLTSVNYIPSDDVAVPANTGSQRLMVSDVLNCNPQ